MQDPYLNTNRFNIIKEEHKLTKDFLVSEYGLTTNSECVLADIGCGNGELINYLITQFPKVSYLGFDKNPEYIKVAKSYAGTKQAKFNVSDVYDDIGLKADIVICTGLIELFENPETVVKSLIEHVASGGYLFMTGLFNDYDVQLKYRNNPEDEWSSNFNQISKQSLRKLFANKFYNCSFKDMEIDLDLPFNKRSPLRTYTFKNQEGKTILTNGLKIIKNKTLCCAKIKT